MKKVIFTSAIALVSALGMQTFAQTSTAVVAESSISYDAVMPTLSNAAHNTKVQALDKHFKDYQAAKLNNETAKAEALKKSVTKWMIDNKAWIVKLDRTDRDAFNEWSELAMSTLRLTETEN